MGLVNGPRVFVTTNDDSATPGYGGVRVYALNAETGAIEWERDSTSDAAHWGGDTRSLSYAMNMANHLMQPNGIPAPPSAVDKLGSAGHDTHMYFGDLEGRIWEVELSGSDDPVVIWEAADAGDTDAKYPITAALALYRDTSGYLHVMAVTGGAYWAPSNNTTQQKLVDVNTADLGNPVVTTLQPGERGYASPVISGGDIYLATAEGLPDLVPNLTGGHATGTAYRVALGNMPSSLSILSTDSSPEGQKLGALGTSAATPGLSKTGKVVLTTTRGAGTLGNPDPNAGNTNPVPDDQLSGGGTVTSKLPLWLPGLK
jgi:hypothetical protein